MPSSDQMVWTSMPEPLLEPRLDGQRPRRVDPAAERRQQRQPPVARARRGSARRRRACRSAARRSPRARPRGRRRGSRRPARRGRAARAGAAVASRRPLAPRPRSRLDLADERAQRPAELDRPADRVALPERQLAGHARGRADRDPVVPDLQDPPAAGAEHDDVAVHPGAELVDHLLVELADAPARRAGLALHEHAEQAAVGDRAAAGDGDDAGVAAALDRVGDAVPDDPRLELGELVRRVGAGEHAQDAVEDVARQGLVGRRARDRREQVVAGPAVHDGHRHELLGEDVERVARDLRGLDRALVHPARDDRAPRAGRRGTSGR